MAAHDEEAQRSSRSEEGGVGDAEICKCVFPMRKITLTSGSVLPLILRGIGQ